MRYQLRTGNGLLMCSLAVSLSGCGLPDDAENMSAVERFTSEIVGTPQGFTCGLAYKNGTPVVNASCMGDDHKTLAGPPAMNFHITSDGDSGLSSGNGFYHQGLSFSSGIVTSPDWLELPRGTACGFKHTCNSPGETCLGMDPRLGCPAGWSRKQASDAKGANGCYFVWCQYDDLHDQCTSLACQSTNVPLGMACGINDSDVGVGPPDIRGKCLDNIPSLINCPSGYAFHGTLDNGRSSGHGIRWCARE